MSISLIKNAIKTNLDALVTAEVLGAATITDIKKNHLDAIMAPFPHAFLMPPGVESNVLDNRSIERGYTFDIVVYFKAENLTSTTELEEKVEDILNQFDNNPTLDGTALGGVLPISSSPEPFQHNGADMIMVVIQIKAKEVVSLTFS